MPLSILIAEASEDDRFFLRRAIESHPGELKVVGEVGSGDEVQAYLTGEGGFADRQQHPLPDLLMLALRMPRMDGLEVLKWLRSQNLSAPKVVMLGNEVAGVDRERAVALGAIGFFPKAGADGDLGELIGTLRDELCLAR